MQSRSEEEEQAFRRGLKQTMDLWYSHAGITVVLLTKLPEDHGTARSYESRGWTTFERCSAELGKSFSLKAAKWKLVVDTGDEEGDVQRRLPTAPARMAELLETRLFTNNADKQGVLELYKRTASAVLGTVEGLDFSGMPLVSGDEWCSPAQLAEALNLCSSLRTLNLSATRLTNKGVEELVGGLDDGALPALTELYCNGVRFSAEGVTTLCNAHQSWRCLALPVGRLATRMPRRWPPHSPPAACLRVLRTFTCIMLTLGTRGRPRLRRRCSRAARCAKSPAARTISAWLASRRCSRY